MVRRDYKKLVSIILFFVMIIGCDIPPDTPVILFPAQDTLYRVEKYYSYKFEWEKVENATNYNIQIAEDADFLKILEDEETSYAFFFYKKDLISGIYFWRVRAYRDGEWSDWASSKFFVIPKTPDPKIPQNGSIVNLNKPAECKVSWTAPDYTIYSNFQIDSDISFSSPKIDKTLKTNEYNFYGKLPPGKYYWRVRIKDEGAFWGKWSEIWMFEAQRWGYLAKNL